jgi:hypothetical protein
LHVQNGISQYSPDAADEPTLIFLGTGSAIPSKYRNVSSTLLQLPQLPATAGRVAGDGQFDSCVNIAPFFVLCAFVDLREMTFFFLLTSFSFFL